MKTPKAYETGHQDFYGRDFLVTKDTLIPRPETEQIIDVVKSLAGLPILPGIKPPERKLPNNPRILDVGTGSGCIAITIKKELSDSVVTAVDISEPALKVAKENAKRLDADIEFLVSDLLKGVIGREFDVVIANLPYVDETWDWLDKETLESEPSLALYAEDHGLALIKKLLAEISTKTILIKKNAYVILEADPVQHDAIIEYASKKGFEYLETRGFALALVAA